MSIPESKIQMTQVHSAIKIEICKPDRGSVKSARDLQTLRKTQVWISETGNVI
jgi:hypothetical protein